MTVAAVSLTRAAFDRRLSRRSVVLVLAGLACLLYAIWRHTVPPGPLAADARGDTMCLIARVGLGGLCH